MEFMLSKNRKVKLALGFNDVSLVPSLSTIDPVDTDVSFELGGTRYELPIIAAAMDGVVDVRIARLFSEFGGLGVLNLEGIYCRYDDYDEILKKIVESDDERVTGLFQKLYQQPVLPELIEKRIVEIKSGGLKAAVSLTPAGALKFAEVVEQAGADVLVIQSTVVSTQHRSKSGGVLDVAKLISGLTIPVILGNCVTYDVAYAQMEAGAAGILVGIGPGQACTTRGVTGVGIPQITATADCAAARDDYFEKTGRYVNVITDGGMRQGGQICKALAAGADAIMTGSIFAGCPESPAAPYHWGMATPDPNLPRGTRVKSSVSVPLKQVLFGPSSVTDGTQNLVGAIKSAMGLCGAETIREFHETQIAVSLSFMTEGKQLQMSQRVGMGK
ncbi:GuaB3 family IMP dehydrogenase-related protein [bacterium]|nr:GuaB3 family IMP dehydrogenase-related protein [bacterium]